MSQAENPIAPIAENEMLYATGTHGRKLRVLGYRASPVTGGAHSYFIRNYHNDGNRIEKIDERVIEPYPYGCLETILHVATFGAYSHASWVKQRADRCKFFFAMVKAAEREHEGRDEN